MLQAKDEEQDYDESGMIAGMEQDFERVIEEKNKRIQYLENENDMLRSENTNMRNVLRGSIKNVIHSML